MSTHEVKVVKVDNIEPHPDADNLEIIKIWEYVCIVRKNQFQIGDLAAYIEPDYIIDLEHPTFAFLRRPESNKTKRRITVSKFRGIYSAGLLVPAPEGSVEGDNVLETLQVERWEPPPTKMTGKCPADKGPGFFSPKYDLENIQKYKHFTNDGEDCILTTKLHGTSGRFCFFEDKMFCGSRTMWRVKPGTIMPDGYETQNNAWWEALNQNPWIEEFCRANPNVVLYGEVVGELIQGKHFHYGHKGNSLGFYVFDILENSRWLHNSDFKQDRFSILKFVPTLHEGPFDFKQMKDLAELKEDFNDANHVREGVVFKPAQERYEMSVGRVAFKYVSNKYLEKGK